MNTPALLKSIRGSHLMLDLNLLAIGTKLTMMEPTAPKVKIVISALDTVESIGRAVKLQRSFAKRN